MRLLLVLTLFLVLLGCGQGRVNYGPYSIGRDETWFPLLVDGQGPNLTGFTNALIEEIAHLEDVPLTLVNIGPSQLFSILQHREVGGIFTSLEPDSVTQEKFDFSAPFISIGPVLVVPSSSEITSLTDLQGKIVAINQFDNTVLLVQQYPTIVIELYQNGATALDNLKNGEYDALLMPTLEAHSLIPSLYPQLKIVTGPLIEKSLRLITLKGAHQSLLRHFNRGLEKTLSSGQYNLLRKTFQI